MDRKRALPAMLGLVIIALVLVALQEQGALDIFPGGVTQEDALDMIRDLYPDMGNYTIKEGENCTGADDECWLIGINTTNGTKGGITVNKKTGSVANCTEWYCNTVYCTYEDVQAEGSAVYYNYGCDNPIPTCDAGLGECRACYMQEDCVRKRMVEFVTQTPTQELTRYEIYVIGSDILGTINDLDMECLVLDGDDMVYFQANSSISECEAEVTYMAACSLGLCGAGA